VATSTEGSTEDEAAKGGGVTPKQAAFVREYLIDLNATQAAIRAGYSAKTAEQQGPRLLGNAGVSAAIAEAQQARANRLEITADRVLQELARIAFFDPRKLLKDDGEPVPLQELDDDTAAAIGGLETATERERGEDGGMTYVRKYKIVSKDAALGLAMRHLGMLKDVSITAHTSLTDLLRMAEERRARRIPG
jgi:phage terminase small subunit